MRVCSKKESYCLVHKGLLGNRVRHWDTYKDLLKSGFQDLVSIRYKSAGGGFFAYGIPVHKVADVMISWLSQGAKKELITFNESAPDYLIVIQGELMNSEKGLCLFHTDKRDMLRNSLPYCIHDYNLKAKFLLKKHLTCASYDDLMELLDLYPDSVIEFSAYSRCLGNMTGRNAVIWEVRNY